LFRVSLALLERSAGAWLAPLGVAFVAMVMLVSLRRTRSVKLLINRRRVGAL
jgi:hypothetical protein